MERIRHPSWIAKILLLSAVLFQMQVSSSRAQLENTAWPMLQHDQQHTGQATLLGPLFPSGSPAASDVQQWLAVDKIKMSPVIGPDGTIYVGMGFRFCAINPNMTQKWCTPLHADVSASAATIGQNPPNDPDGPGYTIFIGDRDNTVTAFRPDGTVKGEYNTNHEGDVHSSPNLGPDGTVFFARNMAGTLIGPVTALKRDWWLRTGTDRVKWEQVLGQSILSSAPTLSLDNSTVYIGAVNGVLHAFDSNSGTERWQVTVGTKISNSSPVVGPDGTIYIGGNTGLAAVKPNSANTAGTLLWTFPTLINGVVGMVDNTAALANDGTLYVGARYQGLRTLFALRPAVSHTTPYWSFTVSGQEEVGAFPVVGADGTVYVALGKGLYAFSPTGTPLWNYQTTNYIISSPAMGGNAAPATGGTATIYVGSKDRNVYAITSPRSPTSGGGTNHAPTAVITPSSQTTTAGSQVGFSGANSSDPDGDPLSMSWDFGDGGTGTGVTPTHTYTIPNTYTVTLTVNDNRQPPLTNSTTATVLVNPSGSCDLPDTFTRSDSPELGNGWVEAPTSSLRISGNHLENASSGDSVAYQTCFASANQTAEADFTSIQDNNPNPRFGVVLRGLPDAQSYYWLYRRAGGTNALRISKVVNGVETILKSVPLAAPSLGVPFHLRGQVIGTTLTVTVGTTQATVMDTTFSSGYPGITLGSNTTRAYQADNFNATNP